jgi:hypothetical protein
VGELDHHGCDVIHNTLFFCQPPLVGLINQLQAKQEL